MLRWFQKNRAQSSAPNGTPQPHFAAHVEQKASRTGALVALHGAGKARWTPRDYGTLAREGYARNPIVYRSIRMIAEAASSISLICLEAGERQERHPLLDLLARPNKRQAGADLFEALYGHLLVSGNAYLEGVYGTNALGELHALRPDRMKVVPGPDGWPQAYDYHVGGKSLRFLQEERDEGKIPPILHLTLFHPQDDHYGLSPLEAAQVSLDIHNAASGWNKALLDNSARPSGALVYAASEGGNLSNEQFERLKQELEEGYQGAVNAGRPLLLEGGLDWKSMSLSPRDMDFIEAKNAAAREIALAFGVPPMLLGIPGDNTYANFAEANRAFWRQTILPLVGRSLQSLSLWLAPAFGGEVEIIPDLDTISALAGERETLWRRIGSAPFLSDEEKRRAVGYSAQSGPSDDTCNHKGTTGD
ncbi:MAG: phage portal protein [Cohaesibacter sp.]|jgi:HK97 family phage portal protein|nr:phage portal protein [Cohaesibacter sp.]